jgi:hypothetical protein
VHCRIGYSRSAAVAGAYLIAAHQATTFAEVLARLREVRPSIIIRPEAMEALRIFARSGSCSTQDPMVGSLALDRERESPGSTPIEATPTT